MKKIPNSKPFFSDEDIESILQDISEALKKGILAFGPHIEAFELEFANYIGVKHAITVSSGTSALEICLRFFNIQNKEVIVPTNSFPASANSVIFAGGKPCLVDINKETLCIEPKEIFQNINSNTIGVMLVHVAGLVTPEINEIITICKEKGLFVIEDAANAHGSMIDNKMAGSLGDAGCFSFYATKNLATGEGGMITTNNDDLAEFAKSVRNHGRRGILHTDLGNNWRINELNAILGRYQLNSLESFISARNSIADRYSKKLESMRGIKLLKVPKNIRHSYWKYPLIVDHPFDRESFKKNYNIDLSRIWNPPIHLQPYYRNKYGYKEGDLPVSEDVLPRQICLPIFVGLEKVNIDYVVSSLENELLDNNI